MIFLAPYRKHKSNCSRQIKDPEFLKAKALFLETLTSTVKDTFVEAKERLLEAIHIAKVLDSEETGLLITEQLVSLTDHLRERIDSSFLKMPISPKRFEFALELAENDRLAICELSKVLKELKPDFEQERFVQGLPNLESYRALQNVNKALYLQSQTLEARYDEFLTTSPDKMAQQLASFQKERVAFIRNVAVVKNVLPQFNPRDSEPFEGQARFLEAVNKLQEYSQGAMTGTQASVKVMTQEAGKMILYFSTDDNAWTLATCSQENQKKAAVHAKLTEAGLLQLQAYHDRGSLL